MRTKLMMLIGAPVLGTLSLPASASPGKEADIKAIREIEEGFLVAKTGKEVAAEFSQDAVMFDPMPPTFDGHAAIESHMTELFSQIKNPRWEMLSLRIETDKDLAFAFSTQRVTMGGGGTIPNELIIRVTDCYRKIDGKWKVVHNHTSLPVDMGAGKVLFNADLKAKE